MAATAKITEKTTKKDMLAYIKTIQKQLEEEKKNRGVDKKAALKVVEQKKVVSSASQTSVEDIIKTFRVNLKAPLPEGRGFSGLTRNRVNISMS